jgi:protein SCO1/2
MLSRALVDPSIAHRSALVRCAWSARLLSVSLVFAAGVSAGDVPHGPPGPEQPAAAPPAQTLPVVGRVPAFAYRDQDGRRVTEHDLRGHVWIADFIYTHCTTACPIMSARFVQLQRAVHDPDVRFVSFSIDPEHDTPAVLKEYADRWVVDETRWRLLSTDSQSLPRFARQLRAQVQRTDDPKDPIDHSVGFILVDRVGQIRGFYDSSSVDDLNRILEDLELLAPPGTQPPTLGGNDHVQARELFVRLGCQGCHADARIASPLGGLLGRSVRLQSGNSVKVDRAYLRESIINPNAKVVDGYPPNMPSYAGQLTERQIDALVEYLAALPGEANKERHLARDPVCKMDVSVGPETLRADHNGKTYYFCSDACLEKFRRSPAAFTGP